MLRIKHSILLLLILSTQILIAGGPWTLAKNKLYVQVSYNLIAENNKLFSTLNDDHSLYLSRAVQDQTIGIYAEYGLTDKLTIVADIPYKLVKNSEKVYLPLDPYQADLGNLNGLGNINLEAKYQFYNKNILLAGALGVSLPTATIDLNTRLSTGYQSLSVNPGLYIGYSKAKFYSYSKIAYHFRPDLTNEYQFVLEAGYKVYKNIYAIIAIDILQSTEAQKPRNNDFTFLYPDQQEYMASTLKISSPIYKNMGINLHMTIITINANYVQKGPAMGGSVYWKF